jgi:hypothetical protein
LKRSFNPDEGTDARVRTAANCLVAAFKRIDMTSTEHENDEIKEKTAR